MNAFHFSFMPENGTQPGDTMTFLYIFTGVSLFFIWLLCLKITFNLTFCENLYLSFQVLFYKREMVLFGEEKAAKEEAPPLPKRKKKKSAKPA